MEIVKIVNPKTGEPKTSISLSKYDKEAINHVVTVLSEIGDTATDIRDKYEFKYSQRFLTMVRDLQDLDDVTDKIDDIIVDEPPSAEYDADQEDIANALNNLAGLLGDLYDKYCQDDDDNRGKA